MRRRVLAAAVLAMVTSWSAAAITPGVSAAAGTDTVVARGAQSAITGKRVIGHSVQGRAITAWHLGRESGRHIPTVVLIATMHGNEGAPRQILAALRDGIPVWGVDLWVVPVYNPDGLARGTRHNAHGVDLNRNYPYHWVDLDGNYESGPRAGSEPETKAMMRFLRSVHPDRILSFHQPLNSVDTDTKKPKFANKVARLLHLPRSSLTCGGVCHGTMTGWYNHHFRGAALTVEYGAHPSAHRMRRTAPAQVLRIFGARREYDYTFVPARDS